MSKKQVRETSKRQLLREQRVKRQRQQRLTLIFGIGAVALLVIALLAWPAIQKARTPVGDFVTVTPNPRPQANFNTMGDPNAPVKFVEYSDFQCPYCKQFAVDTEHQIVETYVKTGKVFFTYVPFGPSGQWIGDESRVAAKAAFCAGDQGKFWEYHDIVFANQTGENVGDFTDKRLTAFAESLGLNMTDFQACYNSSKYDAKLTEGLVQGRQAGAGGTPAFTVNGKLVTGALPFSDFQKEIDAALTAAGAQ